MSSPVRVRRKRLRYTPHHGRGREVVRGFFQHLADAGLDGRFARVQVPGRVVQAQAVGGVFLHQQKMPVAFDQGGHGDVGFPAVWHGGDYRQHR
jgi:hypothetical protein